MHSQLQGLPRVVHALLPELAQWNLSEETLADCSRCVMRPRDGQREQPWHFNARTECCTHHPYLANYLVGRALRREDHGSARVRQRLQNPEGRTHRGLQAPEAFRLRYAATAATAFGQDESLVCPFRTQGTLSCSIWHNRNSTCRTWFCKSLTGHSGQQAWTAVRAVLGRVELDLAAYCHAKAPAPAAEAPADVWEAWFIRCADIVDEIALDHAPSLRSERLNTLVRAAGHPFVEAANSDLPDILVSSIGSVLPDGDGVRLTGYSPYDGTTVSRQIFAFLSELDGQTRWQDAAHRCQQSTGFIVDTILVTRLHALRILRAPQQNDDPFSPEAASPQHLLVDS